MLIAGGFKFLFAKGDGDELGKRSEGEISERRRRRGKKKGGWYGITA